MVITFSTTKLETQCNELKQGRKVWGDERAKRVMKRLNELAKAPTLEVMRNLPGRTHELTGDRAGQLSIDIDHPYRLIFEPDHDPIPRKEDSGLDWSKVTAIRVIEIADTH